MKSRAVPLIIVVSLVFVILFALQVAAEEGITVQDEREAQVTQKEETMAPAEEEEERFINPVIDDMSKVAFMETFQEEFRGRGWIESSQEKYAGQEWKWEHAEGTITGFFDDKGLVVGREAKHHAISMPLKVDNTNKDLVIQYEVKFEKTLGCGGAYIKLLRDQSDLKLEQIDDKSPYVIMFGPDHCPPTDKVHFIFNHFNPKSKTWEEKHMKNPPLIKNDALSHLYTLIIRKDNTFEVLIDQQSVRKGSLLEDFEPSVIPAKEIDDPNDKKPEDWVDNEFMEDPSATRPEDWDESQPMEIPDPDDVKPENWLDNEPLRIPDPEAKKPADWDDEEDGKWEAPLVDNPKCSVGNCGEWKPAMMRNPLYKGKWKPPMIKNPKYQGAWKPKQIPNPNYFEDLHPHNLPKIGALTIEIWTMQNNILFDNFLITHDEKVAKEFAEKSWVKKFEKQKKQMPEPSQSKSTNPTQEFLLSIVENLSNVISEHPIPIVATIVAILISIPLLCCRSSGNKRSDKSNSKPVIKQEEVEEDEVDQEKEDDELMKSSSDKEKETEQEGDEIEEKQAPQEEIVRTIKKEKDDSEMNMDQGSSSSSSSTPSTPSGKKKKKKTQKE